jgi:hypothetical protein
MHDFYDGVGHPDLQQIWAFVENDSVPGEDELIKDHLKECAECAYAAATVLLQSETLAGFWKNFDAIRPTLDAPPQEDNTTPTEDNE